MSVTDMRSWVKSAYTGESWKAKVDKMSDSQVIALYYKLVAQGKIHN